MSTDARDATAAIAVGGRTHTRTASLLRGAVAAGGGGAARKQKQTRPWQSACSVFGLDSQGSRMGGAGGGVNTEPQAEAPYL